MKKAIIHFNTELDRNFKPIEGGLLTGCFCLWFKANPDATKKEIADMISKAIAPLRMPSTKIMSPSLPPETHKQIWTKPRGSLARQ